MSQTAVGLPAATDSATVLASHDANGLPAAAEPTTVLTSPIAGGLLGTAEPRMAQASEGEGGWDVPQVINAYGQSPAGCSLAVPEGAWGAGQPDLAERDGATAMASNPRRPLQRPDRTEPSPVLETLSPAMLSLGRDAKTDLRELASLFPINKDPWRHQQGQERSSAEVREGGVTMLAMGNTTTLDSRESASVRTVANQLATRLVAWVDVTSTEGRTVFHLRLEPPELGSVRVQLSATAGTISAKFIASNEAAGQILQGQLHELRESLAKLGVSCASLDVSYGQGGSPGTAQQRELQPYPWHDNTHAVQDQQLVVWQRRSRPAALIDVLV
ncbi:MAG: flagellar hook-length control protein FliK [Planctomycetota bacterium]|nr:flagellar hook-length control protein FliK [Planctomycetota bacterium]